MSRVGKQAVPVPDGVKVSVDGNLLMIEGPKGKLSRVVAEGIHVEVDEAAQLIRIRRASDSRRHRALHGVTRTLAANMVHGVTQGFEKILEIVGTGYSAKIQGKNLALQLGFADQVNLPIPDRIEIDPPQTGSTYISGSGAVPTTTLVLHSADNEQLGQFAARIRSIRPPEPYNAKGIRYRGEQIRRKVGKAFASGPA